MGGGSGNSVAVLGPISPDDTPYNHASVGNVYKVLTNCTLVALWANLYAGVAPTVQASLCVLSGSGSNPTVSSVTTSSTVVVATTGAQGSTVRIPFTSPITLTAGQIIGLMVTRTDSTTTAPIGLWGNNGVDVAQQWPAECIWLGREDSISITVGDTITTPAATAGIWHVYPEWHF